MKVASDPIYVGREARAVIARMPPPAPVVVWTCDAILYLR
jgi:hypothetical protein